MNDKKNKQTSDASVDWLLDTTPILSFNKQHSVQLSSVAQVCPNLQPHGQHHARNPLSITNSRSLPKVMSTESVMPSHPLMSPSPPTFNLSQHQGLFKWVNSLHQVAKVLEFQLQYQSFQWIFSTDILYDELAGSPCSPRDSQESSPTPQFKSINSSVLSFLHSPTLTPIHDYWKNHSLD